MKYLIKHIGLTVAVCFFVLTGQAQGERQSVNVRFSMPEVAVLDIESGENYVAFEVEAASRPGGEPVIKKVGAQSVWINYSSAIRNAGHTRSINAQISEGIVPPGTTFYIEASPASAFGSPNKGISVGRVQVNANPQPIITGIGNCYTGDGINNGHELSYFLEISDFSKLQSSVEEVFTVMYTITDN